MSPFSGYKLCSIGPEFEVSTVLTRRKLSSGRSSSDVTMWEDPAATIFRVPRVWWRWILAARWNYRICSRNLRTFFPILAAEKSGYVKYADFFCGGLDLGFILV